MPEITAPVHLRLPRRADGPTERLALRAALMAARILGLATGTHLRQLRGLADPVAELQARLQDAELRARLAVDSAELLAASAAGPRCAKCLRPGIATPTRAAGPALPTTPSPARRSCQTHAFPRMEAQMPETRPPVHLRLRDPLASLQARLEEAELRARLAWEAAEILRSRFAKIPEKNRPYFTPAARFRILELRNLLGWNAHDTAGVFLICPNTILNWEQAADPDARTAGSCVKPTPPIRRAADVVRALSQLMTASASEARTSSPASSPAPAGLSPTP